MASIAVICARISAEVWITSIGILLILLPASIASSTPLVVKGTSTQPVNKFFSFHKDSPWRIRISAASSEKETEQKLELTSLYTWKRDRRVRIWEQLKPMLHGGVECGYKYRGCWTSNWSKDESCFSFLIYCGIKLCSLQLLCQKRNSTHDNNHNKLTQSQK